MKHIPDVAAALANLVRLFFAFLIIAGYSNYIEPLDSLFATCNYFVLYALLDNVLFKKLFESYFLSCAFTFVVSLLVLGFSNLVFS